RPTERRHRPQRGREPRVQRVFVLPDLRRTAMRARRRVFQRHGHAATPIAVPDGYTVTPPQLARNAPVSDVLQPVLVNLRVALRHHLDARRLTVRVGPTFAHSLEGIASNRTRAVPALSVRL